MKQYHAALREILELGEVTTDRTGTGTTSHFGMQMRYPLSDGFPLVTTKKCSFKVDHSRVVVVPNRRYKYPVSEGKWCAYLG